MVKIALIGTCIPAFHQHLLKEIKLKKILNTAIIYENNSFSSTDSIIFLLNYLHYLQY